MVVNTALQYAYIRQLTITLSIVKTVADDKFVGNGKAREICLDGLLSSVRLIQEGT